MNTRRLSYGLMFTFATGLVAACGGDNPPPETPPPPPPAAPEPPAAGPAGGEAAPAAPAGGDQGAKAAEPASAPKPGKEKIQGKWGFDFSGEVRAKAEEDAKKKAGANDKDGKKFNDLMKKEEDKRAKHHVEITGDTFIVYDGEKPVNKIHYEVGNDSAGSLTIKLGKDEVSKKDFKGKELTISFKDDNSISVPDLKDDKKPANSYKRQ